MQSRSRSGGRSRERRTPDRATQIRSWIILIAIALVLLIIIHSLRSNAPSSDVSTVKLNCSSSQSVTPFGDSILFYDDEYIRCLSDSGTLKWEYPVGAGASFSVSDTHVVIWNSTQLFIVDRNGRASYNETLSGEIQFARIGSRYCVAMVGSNTSASVLIKNLDGTPVDEEYEAFSNMILLDAGFYGEADQYMWTLSMDTYSTAINTVLNTFMVGKMNTGVVNLGKFLAYRVLFEDNRLRVFTTQQMYTYDYKAVQDMSSTILVYGWELIDAYVPPRGSAYMLLARETQISNNNISELRVLNGSNDRRYTLPSSCIGAAIQGRTLYAVAANALYIADVDRQRFQELPVSLPDGKKITEFFGLTSSGRAIVASENLVYSISLPSK